MTIRLLYLFLVTTCFSCGAEKAEMIAAFEEIQTLANSGDKEELYGLLDLPSRELVDNFTDTNYVVSEAFLEYGYVKGLEISTAVYQYDVKDMLYLLPESHSFFFLYQSINGVPLFNIFAETKVLSDQSETGGRSYVTLATKVNDTAWLTSKVYLTKEPDGYKLDLISLMQSRERIYKQELRAFTRAAGETGDRDLQLKRFAESRTDEEYQLKELQYRRQ